MPPALASHSLLLFLLQVGLLLLCALVLGRLAARFNMPAVVGELTAGVLLGPTLFGQTDLSAWLIPPDPAQFHLLDAAGQLGVLLLVGITGAHIDMGLVRRRRGAALAISVCGLLVPLGLGIATGHLVGGSVVFALFLGVAMCVSAIPVIAKTLLDMKLLHRDVGQLTLAAAMVDDAFGWFALSIVSALATTGVRAGTVAWSLLSLASVLVFAFVVGRPLVRWIFTRVTSSSETVTTVVVLLVLSGAGTHALGLEAILGTFVCGVLISRYGKPDPAHLAPLRTVVLAVLAPLFFASAGLRMDLTALARPSVLGLAALVLTVAIAGKFAGAYLGAKLSRLTNWEALALGAGMNARGVIEVIVALVGLRLGVLDTATYTIIVLVAVVTSLMAPPILRYAMSHIAPTPTEHARLT